MRILRIFLHEWNVSQHCTLRSVWPYHKGCDYNLPTLYYGKRVTWTTDENKWRSVLSRGPLTPSLRPDPPEYIAGTRVASGNSVALLPLREPDIVRALLTGCLGCRWWGGIVSAPGAILAMSPQINTGPVLCHLHLASIWQTLKPNWRCLRRILLGASQLVGRQQHPTIAAQLFPVHALSSWLRLIQAVTDYIYNNYCMKNQLNNRNAFLLQIHFDKHC